MSTHHVDGAADWSAPDGPFRSGQLTFTSFDGGGGAGWQIKESTGLSPTEIERLRAGIDARLDAGVDLPRFPSADDLQGFPRRLVFAADPQQPGDGAMVWWHHAPAGVDGSGRPGNVFTHVLVGHLGREVEDQHETSPEARPIDWWRSPGWLTPYGPDAVRDAWLSGTEPSPGWAISRDRVVDFLFDRDDYRRLSVLRVLLDACAAAITGGPPVILATESTDTAACWVAAATYLTSAATGRQLSFSTLERPDSLSNRLQQGVRLCCVPRADHDRLAGPVRGYVLLADDRDLSTGDFDGEPHRTAAGDTVAVTEWSALSRVVLLDAPTASWALAEISRIGAAAPATPRQPAWPLAMLVAAHQDSFPDGVAAASRVVPNTPDGASSEQLAAARQFVERRDLTVADAWQMVEAATHPGQPLGGMAEQVLGIYVALVVTDLDRLGQPGGPPLPDARWQTERWLSPSVLTALSSAANALRTDPDSRRAAAATLGLTTLIWRLGLLPRFADLLITETERLVWPFLVSDDGTDFVASVGPAPEEVLAAVVRPAVSDAVHHRELGRGVEHSVLSWLFPVGPPESGNGVRLDDRLRVEYAYQQWFADPVAHADQRPLAFSGAFWQWYERGSGPDPTALAELFREPPWSAAELVGIENTLPGRLPLSFYGPAIKSAQDEADVDWLADTLSARGGPEYIRQYGLADLVDLRRLSDPRVWSGADLGRTLDRLLTGGVAGLAYPSVPFDPATVAALQTAMLVASALSIQDAAIERLIADRSFRPGPAAPGVLAALNDAVGRELTAAHLAVAVMIGEPRFPEENLRSLANRWAARVTVIRHGEKMPVLEACLLDQVEVAGLTGSALHGQVRHRLAEVRRKQGVDWQMYVTTEKYALGWLKSQLPGDGWFTRRH